MGTFGKSEGFTVLAKKLKNLFISSVAPDTFKEAKKLATKAYEYHLNKSSDLKDAFKDILNHNVRNYWSSSFRDSQKD